MFELDEQLYNELMPKVRYAVQGMEIPPALAEKFCFIQPFSSGMNSMKSFNIHTNPYNWGENELFTICSGGYSHFGGQVRNTTYNGKSMLTVDIYVD